MHNIDYIAIVRVQTKRVEKSENVTDQKATTPIETLSIIVLQKFPPMHSIVMIAEFAMMLRDGFEMLYPIGLSSGLWKARWTSSAYA